MTPIRQVPNAEAVKSRATRPSSRCCQARRRVRDEMEPTGIEPVTSCLQRGLLHARVGPYFRGFATESDGVRRWRMRRNEAPLGWVWAAQLGCCPSEADLIRDVARVAVAVIGDTDLTPRRCRIGRDIHGVLLERGERNDLKHPIMGGRQHDVGGRAVFVRPQPVRRGHAPAVAGLEPTEAVQRHRAHQVGADSTLVLQKSGRHHRADCVAPSVLRTGATAPVAEKASEWVDATRLQLAIEHITIGHCTSIA
jgi:hypothetical protein